MHQERYPLATMLVPALERQVRLVPVPAYVRSMYAHLPVRLVLELELPDPAALLPLGLRQLLKLALSSAGLTLPRVRTGPLRLVISHGDRYMALGEPDLGQDIAGLTPRILGRLLGDEGFACVLEVLAQRSQGLSTLQRITNHMLQSTDMDKALHAMLCGITSSFGLGFNRAALFIYDERRRVLSGFKALGPGDEAEAHRIWESLEYHDSTIDDVVGGCDDANVDGRFQEFIRTLEIAPSTVEGDELAAALRVPWPQVFRGARPTSRALAQMGLAPEFVLAAVRPHGSLLGLVVADNLYSGTAVDAARLGDLAFFIDQTALVWENLSLLERIDKLARTDDLTGLFNRREIEARLAEERSRCSRSQRSCSVMVIDVDHFKQTNDVHGHKAGDDVLRRVGDLLRGALRSHDIAGRFGGDEFLVVLPETGREQVVAAAGRIGHLARMAGVSLSIGGSTWPDDCSDPAQLVTVADANLYTAKNAGRARACFRGAAILEF